MNDNLPSSMIEMFLANARDEPDRVVLNYKLEEEWQELGWGVIARHASRYAVVLREKGVQAGDRVILVSENRYEWILVDLAIQLLGAIHVPVHAPLTGHQIAYQVNDSAAVLAVVSGHEQASKLDNVELSDQLVLMSFDTVSTDRTYGDLPGTAADVPDEVGDAIMQERVDNPLETTSVATILYTSGTTGEPKGVMLSHHNLVCNTLSSMENFDASGDDIHLNFLPLSHIFARTCDYYASGAATLGIQVTSTLKKVVDGVVKETVSRESLWESQTPQVFGRKLLVDAFAAASDQQVAEATDEAQLVEWQGGEVKMVTGSPLNRKITTRADLVFARQALKALPKPDLLGRQMHPFQDGDMWR